MAPILFEGHLLGRDLVVPSYSFFLTLAFLWGLCSGAIGLRRLLLRGSGRISRRRAGRKAVIVVAAAAVGAFVGARMLHILLNSGYYMSDGKWLFTRIMSFHPVGLSIYGGIFGAVLCGVAVARRYKISLWRLADTMVPAFAGAVILARIGCYLNGCCYGIVAGDHLPWGKSFAAGTPAFNYQVAVGIHKNSTIFDWLNLPRLHPTQLYELFAVAVLLALYFVLRRRVQEGTAALLFFAGYTAFRLINHGLRVAPVTYEGPELFYPVLYGILLVSFAFLTLVRSLNLGAILKNKRYRPAE